MGKTHPSPPVFLPGIALITTVTILFSLRWAMAAPPVNERARELMDRARTRLAAELDQKGMHLGLPIFIRIFKIPGTLEVWLQQDGTFQLFKTYPICSYSGFPGPKLHEGDWQSPEGFYTVTPEQMNPNSQYHLSFNIGYPNSYDSSLDRTGSNIMVHGGCSSRGCFAMTNYWMEEIYLLAHTALAGGQESFSVHVFPFVMTARNMFKFRSSPWLDFWNNLKEGYDAFEETRQVPAITVAEGRYQVLPDMRLALGAGKKDRESL
ncbi:L,D-transpeptidase family protein [Desulfolithobacter dissulfuricans]|nr:murein L,D-transpeptidase family protein [Desulfolithobacter dissulfuricans]